MQDTAFNIFSALSTWAKVLPGWQAFLLRKLVESVEITDETMGEIYSYFSVEQELSASGELPQLVDMGLPQLEAELSTGTKSRLSAMHSLSGVNALAVGETLKFGSNLTVVYGPNGAGKSGYARVLKAACFTRSETTEIVGDVAVARAKQPKPTATFDFDDGSQEKYVYGEPCKRLLDNFAVFDSSCIRVHLDERNAFQVMPYLFDVFPRMIAALGRIQTKLREEITRRTHLQNGFAIQGSDSPVAKALETISVKTDAKQLKQWSVFQDAETTRLAAVEQQLKELRTTDPQEIIRRNDQRIGDIRGLLQSLGEIPVKVNAVALSEISRSTERIKDLVEKASAISAAQFGSEPVQPVGTPAWRDLLSAAIKYSSEAYPEQKFPAQGDQGLCVLCHQQLDADSARRLARFYEVATSEVEAQLKASRVELVRLRLQISSVRFGFFGDESASRRTVRELDTALEQDIAGHVAGYSNVVSCVGEAASREADSGLSLADYDMVSARLGALLERLIAENGVLRRNDTKLVIQNLASEEQLLKDRKYLAQRWGEIEAVLQDMSWVDKANRSLKSFSSVQRDITAKQKALAKELVAQGFIARFVENCAALGMSLPVQFRFAGESGTTDRKIEIANAEVANIAPTKVLSEGEQTAVALADFLTEVEINNVCAGLIFDDPVTSMDHRRKESIALRLVEEAQRRQVIVFTHDIMFTSYLAVAAEEIGVQFTGRTILREESEAPGSVDRLAFPHEHYEDAAADQAGKFLQQARTLVGEKQDGMLKLACGRLRTAYEDFIQKKLFGNVVRRWRENITFTVDQVCFDESIANRVQQRMEFLSRHIDAHSHSVEFHESPLTVELVAKELSLFETIKGDYKKLHNAWKSAKEKKGRVFSS